MQFALSKGGLSHHASGQTYRYVGRYSHRNDSAAHPVNAFTMGGIARDAGLSVDSSKNFFECIQQIVGAGGGS
jgi:hypothetical protein